MTDKVFSPAELAAKSIFKSDVQRMLKAHEKQVAWFLSHDDGSETHRRNWDQACARWDHAKATLDQFKVQS